MYMFNVKYFDMTLRIVGASAVQGSRNSKLDTFFKLHQPSCQFTRTRQQIKNQSGSFGFPLCSGKFPWAEKNEAGVGYIVVPLKCFDEK